ncbi:RNA-directed DNA polymerase, eukaryota, partial [Tanacetum coccineum]
DYRPISLIGSLYKVVTKILASRFSLVISDLISDVQTALFPNRQILDGLFIINEILARCKLKKQQAMIFKVDFAKAYDSVRWDYLDDVLISFGFGPKWRSWIRGSLSSGKASILVNGSPTTEFHLYRCLKQGDPVICRAVEAGISFYSLWSLSTYHFLGQLKREFSKDTRLTLLLCCLIYSTPTTRYLLVSGLILT